MADEYVVRTREWSPLTGAYSYAARQYNFIGRRSKEEDDKFSNRLVLLIAYNTLVVFGLSRLVVVLAKDLGKLLS